MRDKKSSQKIKNNSKMYFDPKIAKLMSDREQNEKHYKTSEIVEAVTFHEIEKLKIKDPLFIAELGAGSHPDRYHKLFEKLLDNPKSKIDWSDASPYMIELAKKHISDPKLKVRKKAINFIVDDIISYLEKVDDNTIDIALAKYTFDHLDDPDYFFEILYQKMKSPGVLVATLTFSSPELKSISSNARFLYEGNEFPKDETRVLKDGDSFIVKFFKKYNNPKAGYLEGAEVIKYYFSNKTIKKLAEKYGFKIYIGSWKNVIKSDTNIDMEQTLLIAEK